MGQREGQDSSLWLVSFSPDHAPPPDSSSKLGSRKAVNKNWKNCFYWNSSKTSEPMIESSGDGGKRKFSPLQLRARRTPTCGKTSAAQAQPIGIGDIGWGVAMGPADRMAQLRWLDSAKDLRCVWLAPWWLKRTLEAQRTRHTTRDHGAWMLGIHPKEHNPGRQRQVSISME